MKGGSHELYYETSEGDINKVRELLDAGADKDWTNSIGFTPLMEASQGGFTDIVQLLLERGADVNKQSRTEPSSFGFLYGGQTALILALENGHTDIANLLLEHGADITKRDANGRGPLYHASKEGHLEIVKILLKNGADIDDDNALHGAASGFEDKTIDVVKFLVEKGANVNKPDPKNDENTPLFVAVKSSNTEILKYLIQHNADVNKANKYGETPLIEASYSGNLKAIGILLDNNADINKGDIDGYTPLYFASANGNGDVVKLLLRNNAIVTKKIYEKMPEFESHIQVLLKRAYAQSAIPQMNVPVGTENVISTEPIQDRTMMVNFHDERSHGRYYTKKTYDEIMRTTRKNPFSRAKIAPANVTLYKAKLVPKQTGSNRKTRRGISKSALRFRSSRFR